MNNKVSSFFRLDEQVFLTMGGVCLLSLIILAFRFSTDRPCAPVSIQVSSDAMMEGLAIRFKAQTDRGKNYSWNFGDGQVSEEQAGTTNHIYKKAGKYTVSVMVNGQCSDLQNVTIQEKPSIANTLTMPIISVSPDNFAYVNEPVRFVEISSNSNSWEWRLGESTIVDATTRSTEYIYKTKGTKSISVKINGNPELIVQKVIEIIEREETNGPKIKVEPRKNTNKPIIIQQDPVVPPIGTKPEPPPVVVEQPKPELPKAPEVSNEAISNMLIGVVNEKVTAGEFSPFLCGNLQIPVLFDGKKMNFTEMCEQLKKIKKKKKIENLPVSLRKDKQTGCILDMMVTIDKKGWTLFN